MTGNPAQHTDPPHLCHATGCPVHVAPKLLMCKPHWRLVPQALRDLVWKHYRPGQEVSKTPSRAYLAAAQAACAAVAKAERARAEKAKRARRQLRMEME